MIRWLAVVFLALVVFSAIGPWLERLGLGRLPGDLHFRFAGRAWFIPLASSALISLIAFVIGRLL